jgi:hypothetical protein
MRTTCWSGLMDSNFSCDPVRDFAPADALQRPQKTGV